jgi:hypothetical protein
MNIIREWQKSNEYHKSNDLLIILLPLSNIK